NERIAPMLSLLYKITPRTTLQLTGELIINDANPSNTDAPVINAFDEDGSGRAFFFPVEDNWYGGFTNDFSEDLTQVYQASLRHEFLDNLNVTANFSWNRSERESGAGGYFSFAGPDNTFGSGAVNPEDGNVNRLVFDQARYVQAWAGNIDINYNISTGPIEHKIILGASYTGIETENTNGFSPLVPPGFVTEMPATNLFNPVYVEFNHLTDFQSSPPFNIQLWEEKEYGFYVQDLISLRNTGLKAMLGLRFNDYDFETLSSSNWAGEEGFFFPAIANTSVVPRVGLLYEFAPALSTYVSFSQSIVPIAPFNVDGTITEEDPKPITGEQWEVGFKGVLADKLTYTLALYQLDRQNVVVAVTPMTSAQDGLRRSRGIELDISGSFFERQNLYFSYGYTGTEIVESGVDDALEGERFNGVPEHFLSLWNTYQLANRLGFGVGVEHRSSWVIQPGSFGSTVPVEEDGYFIVNASLFYDIPMKKGKLDANFTINNIFDDYYFLPTENTLFVKRGAPVGFTFSVGYRFGANP
ncbi:MAG: TonB-dependent receptor, partial [Bacteroidota bacterium]